MLLNANIPVAISSHPQIRENMGRGSGTCAFTPVAVVLAKSFVFCHLAARAIAPLLEEIAQELNSVARILGEPPADW